MPIATTQSKVSLMARSAQAQNKIVQWNELPPRLDKLPPASTTRWVIRRKAAVVEAVTAGLISLEEACRRYTLSVEEFQSWVKAIDKHGLSGLRVTRLQQYRASPGHDE
jgi:hypothetical protein